MSSTELYDASGQVVAVVDISSAPAVGDVLTLRDPDGQNPSRHFWFTPDRRFEEGQPPAAPRRDGCQGQTEPGWLVDCELPEGHDGRHRCVIEW